MNKLFLTIIILVSFFGVVLGQIVGPSSADKSIVYFLRSSLKGEWVKFSVYDSTKFIGKLKTHSNLRHECSAGYHLFWEKRYEDINNLEKHLTRNDTVILKFFLNVSKDEQKNRFLERLNNPEKHWKFSDSDLVEREKWNLYQQAFENAINKTATDWAPWYVIPADHKPVMRTIVSTIITETILSLNLKPPSSRSGQPKIIGSVKRRKS